MAIFTKNGKYWIDYSYEGRRIRECVGTSKRMAEKALAVRKAEIFQDRYNSKRDLKAPLFKDFAEEYLEYSKTNKRSWQRDAMVMKSAMPFFGELSLSQLAPLHMEKYKTNRVKEVEPSTVNRELACLRHMFNLAIRWGKASTSPLKEVRPLRVQPKSVHVLSKEEVERLLQHCKGHLKDIVIVALNTGMRLGEILELKWEDVDFLQKCITVWHSKNGKMRKIPMNALVEANLNARERGDCPYVFYNPRTGTPFYKLHKGFKAALKRAGIFGCRFHDLRHTFATNLVLSDVDLVTVKELLGHSTIEMTMRYSHPTPENKKRAVELLTRNFHHEEASVLLSGNGCGNEMTPSNF